MTKEELVKLAYLVMEAIVNGDGKLRYNDWTHVYKDDVLNSYQSIERKLKQ